MLVTSNNLRLPEYDRKASLAHVVQSALASKIPGLRRRAVRKSLQDEFRRRFKSALRAGRRGSSAEESFVLVFRDTLHEVPVSSKQAGELYLELMDWAKSADLALEASHVSPRAAKPKGPF